jgi:Zn finger protein HypA/HybF involved in hydrogenase expression
MHEESLMKALVRQIEGVAQEEGAAKVVVVHVWVGALSHLTSPEHFREHFDRAVSGTVAEGAETRLELSDDPMHPDANGLRLRRIEVEE